MAKSRSSVLAQLSVEERSLSPGQRGVLELWERGVSPGKTAVELGMSKSAVYSARSRLRRLFEGFRLSAKGRRAAREYHRRLREMAVEVGLQLLETR